MSTPLNPPFDLHLLKPNVRLTKLHHQGKVRYQFTDSQRGTTITMGEEEYFLFQAMSLEWPVQKTLAAFQRHFNKNLSEADLIAFRNFVIDSQLLAQTHHQETRPTQAIDAELEDDNPDFQNPEWGTTKGRENGDLKATLRKKKKKSPIIPLFNPNALLATIGRLFHPIHWLVYLTPLFLLLALNTVVRNFHLFQADIIALWAPLTLVQHLIFSLFTVNLLSKVAAGATCRYYGKEVKSFGIILILGIMPRFYVDIHQANELPRHQRTWVYGSALIAKLLIFCGGIFLWDVSRNSASVLPLLALSLSMTTIVSFIITANPLTSSDGYRVLTNILNERNLLPKAYSALFNLLRGQRQERLNLHLILYALASIAYTLLIAGLILYMLASSLVGSLKGLGMLLFIAFAYYNVRRILFNIRLRQRESGEVKQALAQSTGKQEMAWYQAFKEAQRLHRSHRYIALLLATLAIPLLFTPYQYESSGPGRVVSNTQYEIHTSIEGQIRQVNFHGGERLQAGTVIAKLDDEQYLAQLKAKEAEIKRQQAIIAMLESLPRPEEQRYYQRKLELAATQLRFSEETLRRQAELYKQGTISLDQYDEAQRQHDLDESEYRQAQARLAEINSGVSAQQLVAEQHKLQQLQLERQALLNKLAATELRMPIDGILSTTKLHYREGDYLHKGDFFARAETPDFVTLEIEIPQSDLNQIRPGATTSLKLNGYPQRLFHGQITGLQPKVTEEQIGAVSIALARIENPQGLIKPGMSGYAKVAGEELPLWEAFGRALVRFFMVELWSWVP